MDMNLYQAIKDRKKYLSEKEAKSWIYQTLKALDYMHKAGIFHRDIKPENILLRNDKIKLADLGSCKGIFSNQPFTEYISTRWYRAPECILTDGFYNFKMDIWGLGCVFFEILALGPLFPGSDEIDEINRINSILGSPSDELLQKFFKNSSHSSQFKFEHQKGIGVQKYLGHVSPKTIDLICKMLEYDPDKRLTANECLNHECFKELVEQDLKITKKSQMNFYHNSMLMKSFNDTSSFLKINDSIQYINLNDNNVNNYQANNRNNSGSHSKSKTLKQKKENNVSNLNIIGNIGNKNINNINYNYNFNHKFLPAIKLNHINEDSKDEDSFNSSVNKKDRDSFLRLPKISLKNKKFGGIGNFNMMNSNEFKKLKHNISNHSIENGLFTQYEKKQVSIKKRINEVKKNYVSPYSKKTIENNLMI
jgi:serine/threonine protein kinase